MISKLADVPDLVKDGRTRPDVAFLRIRQLAASEHWQEREVAATALRWFDLPALADEAGVMS